MLRGRDRGRVNQRKRTACEEMDNKYQDRELKKLTKIKNYNKENVVSVEQGKGNLNKPTFTSHYPSLEYHLATFNTMHAVSTDLYVF